MERGCGAYVDPDARVGHPLREADTEADTEADMKKGKEVSRSLPLSRYSGQGALRQGPGGGEESPTEAGTWRNQAFAR
ncbi:hypothetical protein GCM10010371_54290 [Streptomyces subrutilus]|uniref:Uncharacterized protein n=1 Tax=Streptomyces subrutilus TaxID=36818 RepID=A0A918R6J5_9ACTN|nr:hypothetical protein GCM10010371_54290 [Streptomyces subrutilus]